MLVAGIVAVALVVLTRQTGEEMPRSAECPVAEAGVRVDAASVPAGPVAGYRGDQLANAAAIVNAGQALGLDTCAQTIGVMTAMGESSLRVLDRGDAVGPDSRGLLQQRADGAWGSYADRMDPTTSATNFFRSLQEVPDRQALPPTIAAHRTQCNADPHHYERYWDAAVEVVTALAGPPVTGFAHRTGRASSGTTTRTRPARVPSVTARWSWRRPGVVGSPRLLPDGGRRRPSPGLESAGRAGALRRRCALSRRRAVARARRVHARVRVRPLWATGRPHLPRWAPVLRDARRTPLPRPSPGRRSRRRGAS